jgi:hypothetical protein
MHVVFQSRNEQASELRRLVVQRVRFVLRRLSWLSPRARIKLSDINGPHGGVDKRCQIELKTDGQPGVVVTAVAADWAQALNMALIKGVRALMRGWRRSQDVRPARRARAERFVAGSAAQGSRA